MKYSIHKDIFESYPDLRVGLVVGRNLKVGKDSRLLGEVIDNNIAVFLDRVDGLNLTDISNIHAWREAYKSMGVSPSKCRPTAESLLRRVLKKKSFPRINNAVDAYLAVELLSFLPVGGYDLSKVNGDVYLRRSLGAERFRALGQAEDELTDKEEIIYSDDVSVLTRRWNYRDADHVGISEETENIILASEAVYSTISDADLKFSIEKITEYEEKFCGGAYETYFLNSEVNEIDFYYP